VMEYWPPARRGLRPGGSGGVLERPRRSMLHCPPAPTLPRVRGWLAVMAGVLVLAGCSEDIGPSPGVVEGDDILSGGANSLVPYDIQASGATHEAFSLYVDDALAAWIKGRPPLGGVQQGYGNVAPPEGYEDLVAAAAGYTYFYVTATGEHYGKLEVLEITQDHQHDLTSVTFHWWLQTREGERDIGG
jgi:hypothetical protein